MTDIPDPSWKGQPEQGRHEVCDCGDSGYLVDMTYGCAVIPEQWVPIQRCDLCNTLDDDEEAARSYARQNGMIHVRWFPGSTEDQPGDWAVCLTNLWTDNEEEA